MLLSFYIVHPTWWSKVSCCHFTWYILLVGQRYVAVILHGTSYLVVKGKLLSFTWYILLGGQRYVAVTLHGTSYLVVKGMLLLFYIVHPTWWSKVCCCHFT